MRLLEWILELYTPRSRICLSLSLKLQNVSDWKLSIIYCLFSSSVQLDGGVISKSYCYIAGNDRKCIINGGPDQAAWLQPAAIQITRKFKQASFHLSIYLACVGTPQIFYIRGQKLAFVVVAGSNVELLHPSQSYKYCLARSLNVNSSSWWRSTTQWTVFSEWLICLAGFY